MTTSLDVSPVHIIHYLYEIFLILRELFNEIKL
jgi:hypothetical protein